MATPLVFRRTRLVVPSVVPILVLVLLAGVGSTTGCVTGNRDVKTQSLGNGEFRLECRGALASCLPVADQLCAGNRFEIRSGRDDRDYLGPASVAESETRTSEAVIRCGTRGRSLFAPANKDREEGDPGAGHNSPPPVAAPVTPAPLPPRACVPGATQACVGPGACAGGQSCNASGSAFGPCDCGLAPAPPSPPTP